MNKIMILKSGSPAMHQLGDIRRKEDDYIRVHEETDTHYIGNFEEGFGFIDVQFKKEDCRPLTEEERKDLNGKWYGINGTPLYRIYVDEEGNVVKGKTIMKKGIINKITDSEGKDKYPDWVGYNISFNEDIELGRSMVIFMDDEYCITTSRVENVEIVSVIEGVNYVISTRNSIYTIYCDK